MTSSTFTPFSRGGIVNFFSGLAAGAALASFFAAASLEPAVALVALFNAAVTSKTGASGAADGADWNGKPG